MLEHIKKLMMAVLLLSTSAKANIHTYPGEVAIDVEFLYFHPALDGNYFVLNGDTGGTNPNGSRIENALGFHPGFRAQAAISGIEGWALTSCYSYLGGVEHKNVSGPFLFATLGDPSVNSTTGAFNGDAKARFHFSYQDLDVLIERRIFEDCPYDLYLQGGIDFFCLDVDEKVRYEGASGSGSFISNVQQKGRSWGLGPKVALNFVYDICGYNTVRPGMLSLAMYSFGSLYMDCLYPNGL